MMKRCLFTLLLLIPLLTLATPLPADEVFQLSTKQQDPNTLLMKWTIKPGYFLYKKRIRIVSQPDSNVQIAPISFPASQEKTNRQGQHFLIYRNQLPLLISTLSNHPGETLIDVHFQGCSDEGFCYPPEVKRVKLTIDSQLALSEVTLEPPSYIEQTGGSNEEVFGKEQAAKPKTTQISNIELLFSSSNWMLVIISFFGFGLLLSFTPCVLPMIPVLSGIIVGHGHTISTRKAFLLSLSYVLSMSITYGAVGAIIALLGSNLQVLMQSPWTLGLFSFVFVLLALSMFNVYELRLPITWQNNLAKITRSQSGGHYLSAALMGCMSTLILSPCVTAPLIGVLSYIAQTGDIILGLFSLFFLGLGMGMPLLLIGTSAGKLLPKAGSWMNAVKTLFGVILLGVAIYLMSRLLPPTATMVLWSSLLIFTGIYLKPFSNAVTNQDKFKQGLGVMLLTYGLFILYGASAGHVNPLFPLRPTEQSNSTNTHMESTVVVKTIQEAQQALQDAKNDSMPVMLDFYADWCASCKVIAQTTLQDDAVLTQLQRIKIIQADITKNDKNSHALLNYFHVVAPPTFLFYDAKGKALEHLQLVGDISIDVLLDRLKQIY
ncbi:MAG: protein-disulfide reductase DsbD [Legionellaceae bacterium]|nr:protein-disulfide reductase DsbD [Legionellaceae bacterium]